ncbi:KilA N-domain-containing protein [Acanthamoeba castellanii mamavirus]|nr:KilA N-domain-containing protein [Acanthamoeba castellanii mamavirus]
MKVQKSSKKPLKRSASFTNGTKSGSKSMKSSKSSLKSHKKIYKEIFDSEISDNESFDSEISDSESSDNESSDNESSDNESSVESSDEESEYEIKKPRRIPSQYSKKFTDNVLDDESDDDNQSDNESSDINSDDDNNLNELKNNVIEVNKSLSKNIISNGDITDIRNIIYEKIDKEISKGIYGTFNVLIMIHNGYINVTKVIQYVTTKKKKFNDWKSTKQAQELIEEVSSVTGIPVAGLFIAKNTGSKKITEIRGTYAHPDLVPHIVSWASAKFGHKVSKIVNDYMSKKMFDKHEQLIKGKDDKIAELTRKIDKQTSLMKDQKSTIKEQDKKINELLSKSNEVLGYAKDTNRKITHVVKERVPYSDEPKIEHQLIIMKNNDEPIKPKKGEKAKKIYGYTALRIMNKSKSATMNRYYKDHPDGETVLTIDYTPNAMHLWNQCKMELIEDEKIRPGGTSCSSFNLRKEYSERKLKKILKEFII